jgi:hypothetical protein
VTKDPSICALAHQLAWSRRLHHFPFSVADIPRNGLYVLFERGEEGHGGSRVVRIGTHTGQNQLRSRVKQHFLVENKDRSIFRKNVGRALLSRACDSYAPVWETDLTPALARAAPPIGFDMERQREIERQVSEYIRNNFRFVVVEVPDKEKRLQLEAGLISLVSNCSECRPSANWLGLHSPKSKIRESGLWQVNELYKTSLDARVVVDLLSA